MIIKSYDDHSGSPWDKISRWKWDGNKNKKQNKINLIPEKQKNMKK